MNRAVIYGRVSTEDQLEKYGLPTQLRACREHALKVGLNTVAEVTDDGISGTILDRPGLEQVRKMVRDREVDVVLMLDVDRLSRELSHLLILKPEIEKFARLEFVTAKFEDSPSGRLFFGIRGVIAQYERELTRERTMRGKKERARSGLIVGGRVAYGYRYREGKLVEDSDKAPIARRIFAEYDAGRSLRGIALLLRKMGAPTWSGRNWCKSSVNRILSNETYAGVAYYGTHRREGKLLRLRDTSERIALSVPALVPREQWERVQTRLGSNKWSGRPSLNFLLRSVLFCAKCGRKMGGENSRKCRSYRCTGRDPLRITGERCLIHVSAPTLDTAAWSALVKTFSDPDVLRAALKRRESELRNNNSVDFDELEKRASRLRRKEETALSAMLDPDLSSERSLIKAQYKAAADERRRIESEISALRSLQRPQMSVGHWIEETVNTVRNFIAGLNDAELRQQFVRRLVSRAEWDGEELKMVCFVAHELAQTY
jgi:site-specific DNA recombinase